MYKAAYNEMSAQNKYISTTPFYHYNTPHIAQTLWITGTVIYPQIYGVAQSFSLWE